MPSRKSIHLITSKAVCGCAKHDVSAQIYRSNIIKMKKMKTDENLRKVRKGSQISDRKNEMDVNRVACQDVAQVDSNFGPFQMQWLSFRLHTDKDHMNDIKFLTKTS